MKFITIETEYHGGKEQKLLRSSAINKIHLEIIGKGIEWKGFTTKFQIIIDYLSSIDDELVCLTDSRDVLYMSDEDTIYNTFIQNFDKDSIVFNGETNCFPEPILAELHPRQDKKYKYLNSGCIIGSRETLLQVCKEGLSMIEGSEYNDDQFILQNIFIEGKYNITLDYDCKIFQCVWDEDWGRTNNFDLAYHSNGIYNRLTKTKPLIFHFPGPSWPSYDSQTWKILNNKYLKPTEHQFF
jgi:hypothetical protein